MSLTVVTRQEHTDKRWLPRTSFSFAANDAVALLLASEVARAVHSLPIAFVKQGEGYTLVAVMGLEPGQNLLVTPTGQWQDFYMPLGYQTGPFRLGHDDSGNSLLCVEDTTGLVSDTAEGERFFDEDGQLSESVNAALTLLGQIEASRKITEKICTLFTKHGLIEPWNITVDGATPGQRVEGLYRINEPALNALPSEAFLEIRQSGALSLVYCQLISMYNLKNLAPLFAQHHAEKSQNSLGETFSFANL